MVVALPVQQLRVGVVDAGPDRDRLAEVERRALDRADLAGRNLGRAGRKASAAIVISWSRMSSASAPARLKYGWALRITWVGAPVLAMNSSESAVSLSR